MRPIFLCFLPGLLCTGQALYVGATAGGRVTDDVALSATPESKRYVAGPMIELSLPLHFAVEFDALYHRHGYRARGDEYTATEIDSERANSWEFPLLLKYKFAAARVQPFVEAGVAPRAISGKISKLFIDYDLFTGQPTMYPSSVKTDYAKSLGRVAGAGVQLEVGRLRLSPEVRFTNWSNLPINGTLLEGPPFQSARNQVDFLMGIGWRVR
jgi:hypothetical protein